MARKKAKLTLKKVRKVKKVAEAEQEVPVDTEFYEVEKVVGQKLEENTMFYEIKWRDWPESANTFEAEYRLTCDRKLLDFGLTLINPDQYLDSIEHALTHLEDGRTHQKKVIESLPLIAISSVLNGSVKFVDRDTVTSRILFLKYLRDHDQTHILHSAFIPPNNLIDISMRKYLDELKIRCILFHEYPIVGIEPVDNIEAVFYPPPPLSTLIFEPVTEEMVIQKTEYVFVERSDELGFNKTRPFMTNVPENREAYEKKFGTGFSPDPNRPKHYDGMMRLDYARKPRFFHNLKLVQSPGTGLILKSAQVVQENSPVIMMCGVIRPAREALESLRTEGERIAFSSFVELPGTEFCLDRRQFYDFSKFIPHSCSPTCAVRLVDSGNGVPDLVVYTLEALNNANLRSITIDYFKGFEDNVNAYFLENEPKNGKIFDLYETNIDFVHCQCQSDNCREVLYVDRSTKRNKKASKIEKLASIDPSFEFRGMSLAESTRVWNVHNGDFVDQV